MSKSGRLNEYTTEPEVFQNMDDCEWLNDSTKFSLSIRLQFPKFSKGFTSSFFEPFIKSHIGTENLVSLGRLSFPNEWQMSVRHAAIREKLIRLGRTKINGRTCWIAPLSQSEVRGNIHWIPTSVPNDKLALILRRYGEVLFIENTRNRTFFPATTDTRYFALYLNPGKSMDDIEHFFNVEGFKGLIIIRGRNPICFHCKEVGHRKADCKTYKERIRNQCLRRPGTARQRKKPRGMRNINTPLRGLTQERFEEMMSMKKPKVFNVVQRSINMKPIQDVIKQIDRSLNFNICGEMQNMNDTKIAVNRAVATTSLIQMDCSVGGDESGDPSSSDEGQASGSSSATNQTGSPKTANAGNFSSGISMDGSAISAESTSNGRTTFTYTQAEAEDLQQYIAQFLAATASHLDKKIRGECHIDTQKTCKRRKRRRKRTVVLRQAAIAALEAEYDNLSLNDSGSEDEESESDDIEYDMAL